MRYGRDRSEGVDKQITEIENFKNQVGQYPGTYSIWNKINVPFPEQQLLSYLDSHSITPVIFMESQDPTYSDQQIANGVADEFFKKWAQDASRYGKRVILRYDQEMNGGWFAWGHDAGAFITSWKHIHDVIRGEGATNVEFFWCPWGGAAWAVENMGNYYPGDDYADYVGFDAYSGMDEQTHRSMQALYSSSIDRLNTLAPNKPIIIGETGISAHANGQANFVNYRNNWIKNGYEYVYNNWPKVKAILYLNYNNIELGEGARDWKLDTDPNVTSAYAALAADPRFQGSFSDQPPVPTPTSGPPPPTLTPGPTSPPVLLPIGVHDGSSCTVSSGWACDPDNFNQPIDVHFYADGSAGGGGRFIGTATASAVRESAVGDRWGGNRAHGFSFTTPQGIKDGRVHTINAYAINIGPSGGNPLLPNSPRSVTCAPGATPTSTPTPTPTVTPTPVPCSVTSAWNGANPATQGSIVTLRAVGNSTCNGKTITFDIRRNAALLRDEQVARLTAVFSGTTATAQWTTVWKNGCIYRFSCDPKYFFNTTVGTANPVRSINPLLTVVKAVGPPPNYVGYFDQLNCNQIFGWAADRNRLNTSINVDIYSDGRILTTVVANQPRQDVNSFLKDNGHHGFKISTPDSIKDNKLHTLTVKYAGTNKLLGTNSKKVTCAAPK